MSDGQERRLPPPREPSTRFRAIVVMALISVGWLLIVATGICSAGLINMVIPSWPRLFSTDGLIALALFGCIPIFGTVAMLVATVSALRKHRSAGNRG